MIIACWGNCAGAVKAAPSLAASAWSTSNDHECSSIRACQANLEALEGVALLAQSIHEAVVAHRVVVQHVTVLAAEELDVRLIVCMWQSLLITNCNATRSVDCITLTCVFASQAERIQSAASLTDMLPPPTVIYNTITAHAGALLRWQSRAHPGGCDTRRQPGSRHRPRLQRAGRSGR